MITASASSPADVPGDGITGVAGVEAGHYVVTMLGPDGEDLAVECRETADGTVNPVGEPLSVVEVIEQARRLLAGKSRRGSVTLEGRRLAIAVLALTGLIAAEPEAPGHVH